jgi:hypothetical protein
VLTEHLTFLFKFKINTADEMGTRLTSEKKQFSRQACYIFQVYQIHINFLYLVYHHNLNVFKKASP